MTAAKQLLWSKMEAMSTELLVDVCIGLKDTFTDESNTVVSMAMTLLEERMTSDAFVAFCGRM